MRRGTLCLAAAAAMIFASASAADAAQRFVAPGAGGTCTPASPCSLTNGVNNAAAGDEVIIASGTYDASSALSNGNGNLYIHGASGTARPVIRSGFPIALLLSGGNARVSDLDIQHTGPQTGLSLVTFDGLVERVNVTSTGAVACSLGASGVFRDSVCANSSTSNGGTAVRDDGISGSGTSRFRNITAVATGPASLGMRFRAGMFQAKTVDLRDVIASGVQRDLEADAIDAGSQMTVTASNSNFDSSQAVSGLTTVPAPGSGTNQTALPIFTETTLYHQAPNSPTVDAGAADASSGMSDLDGDPRPLGAANDIGADERVPDPVVIVEPPEQPTDRTAPETTISKGPKKKTKSKKAKFVFQSTEVGSTFSCKVDTLAAKPCASPLKLKRLKPGRHTVAVVATDAAGNADATAASYRWKIKKRKKR